MATIGTLSKATGVNIETIRYYERVGLTPRAERSANGRRCYRDEDAQRLAFIRHARDLGFDLATIRTLIRIQEKPSTPCARITELAQAQLADVEVKITQLTSLRRELKRMIDSCKNGAVADCRIMEAMIHAPAGRGTAIAANPLWKMSRR